MNIILSFICGVIFAIGLGLSGMTDPAKVLGFLEIGSSWDPALAFVMVGAIGVHGTVYTLFRKRKKPMFAASFAQPKTTKINMPLMIGALTFGAGWGLGGFCPGPAVVSSVSLQPKIGVFVVAMLTGWFVVNIGRYILSSRASSQSL